MERKVIATGEIAGPWHTGPAAPNGCVDGQTERHVTIWEVFTADYYGTGEHTYLYQQHWLENRHGYRSYNGGSTCGDPVWIADFLRRHNLTLPA